MTLTLQGDDPEASWKIIMENLPPDAEFSMEVHGMHVNALPPPMPTFVYYSKA